MTDLSELKNYLDQEGRLTQWPSPRILQRVALDYLATKLEIGQVYSEKDINKLLNLWHTFGDPALLRRELYELGLLNRHKDGAEYWRTPNTKFVE
jgi:hypothetical protein